MPIADHTTSVAYRATDDGVWLECDCGLDIANLGHHPTVADIVEASDAHIAEEALIAAANQLAGFAADIPDEYLPQYLTTAQEFKRVFIADTTRHAGALLSARDLVAYWTAHVAKLETETAARTIEVTL
ncbi:hypothetical protein [Leifsonia sp. Leaf264]|uniref:hypothetical protein n=1 Tax=Leifsonia sp. Leaf264 TaxID=1736314 RepID=UPI0006F4B393|nr:hypothetical protein [Leifsonia sp. Leaf264]KQO98362.1 hypothetical protein ASF30_09895 [Leifsonia sp. Leaf264]